MSENKETQRKVFCRRCKQTTNHLVINHTPVSDVWDEGAEWYEYYTLQCKGCETVCLLEEYSDSEGEIDPRTGKNEITVKLYPQPLELEPRSEIKELRYLPKSVSKIYMETIKAFNAKMPTLTSIGLRATVEGICSDQKVKGNDLATKIDGLADKEFMTKREASLLHLLRFMGNASAHELEEPLEYELVAGLEIVEATLRNAYILSHVAGRLEGYKKPAKGEGKEAE